MKLPVHLVPAEIEWQDPDGETLAITKVDTFQRYEVAFEIARTKQSFETVARRMLQRGLRAHIRLHKHHQQR
jgi:hypothetical protein